MGIIAKVDKKGRVLLQKEIREKLGIKEGSNVKIKVEGRRIVLEPIESIADKYFGIFKIDKWPDDLDDFIVKAIKKWRISEDI
ncbi:MAG: AbrB/MazE/SpoVT family DNA-binding domain-containing protein [Candidatus Asgardarchaeia archaeon]